ncbi:MAG: photosynthetic reaction center cytochrome PufC [Rubrivivax sp.]|jgi:photosynthetic reaction center cytochrome c subunit|nr:photosynthetic reaction center cytochrome PufC [Rubrivivax sp.]
MRALSRAVLVGAVAAVTLLAGCERPPVDAVQRGYRGTAMELVYNPRTLAAQAEANVPPAPTDPAPTEGPKARDVYQNVKVLGDLSVAQFNRHMAAITAWVSPQEGCTYCHNAQNFADESKYTKVVARRMLQMTQNINVNWKQHVADTGVTCYTCHRGQPVPAQIWFTAAPQDKRSDFIGNLNAQNQPAPSVGLATLPYDPFTQFLASDPKPIRLISDTALPAGSRKSIQQTEYTYSLMVHMSTSLGVNCTYCHNSRSFAEWNQAPPQRATAWHGIRMARNLNDEYLTPLTPVFPAQRLGPTGDVAKVNCSTCHQGAYKPLYGAQMAKDYPELLVYAGAVKTSALPPPVAEARRSVLYFDVGSPTLHGEQEKGLGQLVATMSQNASTKATISGYHSAAGNADANHELAKQRAFTVRDSLLAAGIAESRVILQKPVQTQGNIAGEDPEARRVEVTVR